MKAVKWFWGFFLVLTGFVLGILMVMGTLFFLISLPSRFLPTAAPSAQPYTPPALRPGDPVPGRAEARLYDLSVSPGGLSARADATIAEALVDNLARQLLDQLQKESQAPVRVTATRVAFTEGRLYATVGLETGGFEAGSAQPLRGDAQIVVEGVEVVDGGYRAQVELAFGEDMVNSFLAWELPRLQEQGKLPLRARSMQVSFREGKLRAVANLEVLPFAVDVRVQARLGVREGRLELAVEDIDLGRLPLPGPLVEQVNSFIDQGIAQVESQRLPFRLQEVRLEGGRMTVRALVETK